MIGSLKLKAEIFHGAEAAMSADKASLLEAIDREGSISAAGRALGLSYRWTWVLVAAMNRCWAEPLVEASPGGGPRKGARLTATGRAVLAAYRALEAALLAAAHSAALDRLEALMAPQARPDPSALPEA